MKVHLKPNGVQMRTIVTRIYTLITEDGRVEEIYENNGSPIPEMDLELTEEQFKDMCIKYAGSEDLQKIAKGEIVEDNSDEW